MKLIDPHIHMMSRTTDDYEKLCYAQVVAVIEPSFWAGTDRKNVGSFLHYFEHITTFEPQRAWQYRIRHFTCLGVNPKDGKDPKFVQEVLDATKEMFSHKQVVAVGEIGLDEILPGEEEGLRLQLEFAKKIGLPILIHTPHHNKKKGVERIIAILKELQISPDVVLIDHNTEETMPLSRDYGAYCGLTVYPITKLSPERAVNIAQQYGADRLLINSSADWGYSDPLSVPKVKAEMEKRNFPEEMIEKILFHNPKEFFGKSGRFQLE